MPSGLVGKYQRFEETYCLHLQGVFLRNADIYLQIRMALQPRKPTSTKKNPNRLTVFQKNVLRGKFGSNKEEAN
jgi:hypothetical protein